MIEKDLNMIKLVRNIKRSKILWKCSMMTPDIKLQIAHSNKNVIDLDSESESDDQDDCINNCGEIHPEFINGHDAEHNAAFKFSNF